ncbi:PREDICTED: lysM domain receptor-like kinase 3 [Nicotiana attenuata]|uniref:Lysm domain receptor-like kinase 3 n=1 Tax=Nicotiana attenuata TaxID=49451 RepID=A0A1J6K0Z1_NICAT|nr:PREDICTED: lysM domain receptor-like kinase 3 [Nicotiana attenuata]OIT22340.1 lysm domain receptor-like kinase 3 [Nicotiana attenuata]
MCKSKKKLSKEVMEPKQKPRRSSSSSTKKLSSFTDQSSSSTSQNLISPNGSTTSFIINNFNNNKNSQSWASSSKSSRHSLSSLKGALLFPEQTHIYNFSEIRSATQNFLKDPLSSSSTSTSWRCLLRDQNVVVIQRKFRRKMETDEVIEHVAMICRSHHSSLIPLKGASVSGNYIYLVYEYIQGVNLSEALRNPRNPNFTVLSNWISRIQIASDIAHGLDYIHHSTGLGLGFVHNHIKSTSIIITEPSLHAKICHFGTAELCGETRNEIKDPNSEVGTKKASELKKCGSKGLKFEGTRGYMAPEFQWTGMATVKSDVYAFGVVVLELISGKEAVKYEVDEESGGYTRVSVIETAAEAAGNGGTGLRGWVDRRLKDSYPVDVAEKLVHLGLDCVETNPNNRPDMGRVAGRISQMYLESQTWAEKFAPLTDFTVSLGPR